MPSYLSKLLTYFNVLFMPMCLPNTWIQMMTDGMDISPREKALYVYSLKSSTNRRGNYCIYSLARLMFFFLSV